MLNVNGFTKRVKMNYSSSSSKITLMGKIDILDFSMAKAFNKFAKACQAKHKGKTWSEANFILISKLFLEKSKNNFARV